LLTGEGAGFEQGAKKIKPGPLYIIQYSLVPCILYVIICNYSVYLKSTFMDTHYVRNMRNKNPRDKKPVPVVPGTGLTGTRKQRDL
jgi:hypothetical protein